MGEREFDAVGILTPPGMMEFGPGDESTVAELSTRSTRTSRRRSGQGSGLGSKFGCTHQEDEDFMDIPCIDVDNSFGEEEFDQPSANSAMGHCLSSCAEPIGRHSSVDTLASRMTRTRKKLGLHLFVPANFATAGGLRLSSVDEDVGLHESSASTVFLLRAREVLTSVQFNACVGLAIIVNAIINGMEIDNHPAAEGSDVMLTFVSGRFLTQSFFDASETCFFVLFGLEFGARLYVKRTEMLFELSSYIDFLALMPALLMFSFDLQESDNATTLQLARLLKLLRLFRLFGVVVEIRAFVFTVVSALRGLLWIFMMMLFLVYISAVLCTILVGHNVDFDKDNTTIQIYEETYGEEVNIHRYWGSTVRSMFTLFQVFTLDDWNLVVRPIVETHSPWMVCFFVVFIFLTTFGLLNLLMGTIVDHAISRSKQADKEQERILQHDYNKVIFATMRLFGMIDVDGNGQITPKEIEAFMRHNSIQDVLQKDFEQLNIHMDYTELSEIYEIIIEDWSVSKAQEDFITPEEFAGAAMRLQGQAKSRDMLMVLVTVQSMMGRLEKFEKGQRKLQVFFEKQCKAQLNKLDCLTRVTKGVREAQRELAAAAQYSQFGSEVGTAAFDSERGHRIPSQVFPQKTPTAPCLPTISKTEERGAATKNLRCMSLEFKCSNKLHSPRSGRVNSDSLMRSRQNTEDSIDGFKGIYSSTVSEETPPEDRNAMAALLSQREALVRHGGDCMSNLMRRLPTLETFLNLEVRDFPKNKGNGQSQPQSQLQGQTTNRRGPNGGLPSPANAKGSSSVRADAASKQKPPVSTPRTTPFVSKESQQSTAAEFSEEDEVSGCWAQGSSWANQAAAASDGSSPGATANRTRASRMRVASCPA